MKKILILMTSARRKNTSDLVDYLVEAIDKNQYQVNRINIASKNIEHCTGCDYCGSQADCIKDDDMQDIYKEIDRSDIIVLASPVYFNSVNSIAKAMIDRSQKYWSMKYSLGQNYKRGEDRRAIVLATGGASYHYDQFNGIYPVADYFFRAINADYKGNYFVSNTDKIPVGQREDVKRDLISLGENIGDFNGFTIQK